MRSIRATQTPPEQIPKLGIPAINRAKPYEKNRGYTSIRGAVGCVVLYLQSRTVELSI